MVKRSEKKHKNKFCIGFDETNPLHAVAVDTLNKASHPNDLIARALNYYLNSGASAANVVNVMPQNKKSAAEDYFDEERDLGIANTLGGFFTD